ncbi:MAG: DUF2784 domain-containing protein [Betaproteobacteria bacterium]
MPYQALADAVLALHVAVAAFVVGGLVFILIGNIRHWRWVNSRWFRLVHLGAVALIVAEIWLQFTCPLTVLEMWLRTNAHDSVYSGSFIAYWLHRLLYYDAPAWMFLVAYTLFAMAVVAAWIFFPPNVNRRSSAKQATEDYRNA